MRPAIGSQAKALRGLRARWALFLILGAGWLAGIGWLVKLGQRDYVTGWLLAAALVFGVQAIFVWSDLPKNMPKGGKSLLPGFGPGTWLSFLRLTLISLLAGFFWPPPPGGWLAWLPFTLYVAFSVLDLLDGVAARFSGTASELGERLDIRLDGLGVLVATSLAYHYGAAGWWFLLVGVVRYAYVFGIWTRSRRGLDFHISENLWRRPIAGIQMGICATLLAPGLPRDFTVFLSTLSMAPFLANFLYDWLAGIGWLKIKWPLSAPLARQTWNWTAILLRAVIFATLCWRFVIGAPLEGSLLLEAALGFGLALGVTVRPLVVVLLVLMAIDSLAGTSAIIFIVTFFGMALLYLGGGEIALIKSEDKWMVRRAGDNTAS